MKKYLLIGAVLASALFFLPAATFYPPTASAIAKNGGSGTNNYFYDSIAGSNSISITNISGNITLEFLYATNISWIRWGGGSTVDGAEILWNPSHPNELQITSKQSISLNAGYGLAGANGGAIQIGSSGAYHDVPYIQYDQTASVGAPNGYSKPFGFALRSYTNSAELFQYPIIQSKSISASTGDYGLEFYNGGSSGNPPQFLAGAWVVGARTFYVGSLYSDCTNSFIVGGNITNYGNILVGGTAGGRWRFAGSFMESRNAANNGNAPLLVESVTFNSGILTTSGGARMNDTRIAQASGGHLTFSSDGTDANTGIDTGIKRASANVAKFTDGSTGNGWLQWGGTAYATADQTTTSATFANTGLQITNVISGHKYTFVAELYLSDSVAADGAKINFNGGSAAATNFRAQVTAFDTALNLSTVTTTLATSVAATTFTGAGAFEIHGSFEPSGSGTFIIQFGQNAHTTGTLTLARGSHITMVDCQ